MSILVDDVIGHGVKKKVLTKKCLSYGDIVFESLDLTPLGFCLWGLDEERRSQKKGGHT